LESDDSDDSVSDRGHSDGHGAGLPANIEMDPAFYAEMARRFRCGTASAISDTDRNHRYLQYQRKRVAGAKQLDLQPRMGLDFELSIILHWSYKDNRYVVVVGNGGPRHLVDFPHSNLGSRIDAALQVPPPFQQTPRTIHSIAAEFAQEMTDSLKSRIADAGRQTGYIDADGEAVVDPDTAAKVLVRPQFDSQFLKNDDSDMEGPPRKLVAKMINTKVAKMASTTSKAKK
jgi:hypothetical protein